MENTKTKLSVAELWTLHGELTGTETQAALLSQKLSLTTKFYLTKLAKTCAEHKTTFESVRNEKIKELGTADEAGTISVPELLEDGTANENFITLRDAVNELLLVEQEIEHPAFSIEDFAAVETEGFYPVFFKLLGL
jgi:hypothetical protein